MSEMIAPKQIKVAVCPDEHCDFFAADKKFWLKCPRLAHVGGGPELVFVEVVPAARLVEVEEALQGAAADLYWASDALLSDHATRQDRERWAETARMRGREACDVVRGTNGRAVN